MAGGPCRPLRPPLTGGRGTAGQSWKKWEEGNGGVGEGAKGLVRRVLPQARTLGAMIEEELFVAEEGEQGRTWARGRGRLLKEGDPAEYRSLLEQGIGAMLRPAVRTARQRGAPAESNERFGTARPLGTQDEVLRQTVKTLFDNPIDSRYRNVLCHGLRKSDRHGNIRTVTFTQCLDSVAPSASFEEVLQPSWRLLLLRIGDSAMLQLLTNAAIFVPLKGGGVMQVAGTPFHRLAYDFLIARKQRQGGNTTTMDAGNVPSLAKKRKRAADDMALKKMRTKGNGGRHEKRARSRDVGDEGDDAVISQPVEHAEPVTQSLDRDDKPSSHADVSNGEEDTQGVVCEESEQLDASPKIVVAAAKEAPSPTKRTRRRKRGKRRKEVSGGDGGDTDAEGVTGAGPTSRKRLESSPKTKARIGQLAVERYRIFYSHRFSSTPGLPARHSLSVALGWGAKGVTNIANDIFRQCDFAKPKSKGGGFELNVGVPKAMRRVAPLIGRMIKNNARCPYAVLLRRYCPLPDIMNKHRAQAQEMSRVLESLHSLKGAGRQEQAKKKRAAAGEKPPKGSQKKKEEPRPSVADAEESGEGFDGETMQSKLLSSYSSHKEVAEFLWQVLFKVLPKDFLGANSAQRALRRLLNRFVRLRRYDTLTAAELAKGMKTKSLPWITLIRTNRGKWEPSSQGGRVPRSLQMKQQSYLLRWLYWLFNTLLVPLIRAHFYVTEAEGYGNAVFYYRKPVWAALRRIASADLAHSMFRRISDREAARLMDRRGGRQLGFSRIRFKPKRRGLRPISDLSSRPTAKVVLTKSRARNGKEKMGYVDPYAPSSSVTISAPESINSALRPVHAVFEAERRANPHKYAGSVLSAKDAYQRLQPFLRKLRAKRGPNPTNPVYIASCDVERAYDNLPIVRLINAATRALEQETYLLVQGEKTIPYADRCIVNHVQTAVSPKAFESFGSVVKLFAGSGNTPVVINDKGFYSELNRENILALLKEHLLSNVVRIGRHFHVQHKGIPQGSVLSSLMCSLLYGRMERAINLTAYSGERGTAAENGANTQSGHSGGSHHHHHSSVQATMQGMRQTSQSLLSGNGNDNAGGGGGGGGPSISFSENSGSDTILLRLVDDQLFISTSLPRARQFVSKMVQGVPEYGVKISTQKTQCNFATNVGGGVVILEKAYEGRDGRKFIKWCGLLIETDTLEVQNDYTRFEGQDMRTTISTRRGSVRGRDLVSQVMMYIKARCRPILLDTTINSPFTVRLNMYQLFLFGAMKFHCFVRELAQGPSSNPEFFSRSMLCIIKKMISRFHGMAARIRTVAGRCEKVSRTHILYLGLCAFRRVLEKKQARYGMLTQHLEFLLKTEKHRVLSRQLAGVIDPKKSAVFDFIVY